MFTEIIPFTLAAQIEGAEVQAWQDLYAALPPDFAQEFQLELLRVGSLALTRCPTIPFIHFNCVSNLGLEEPATEQQIDKVLAAYRDANVSRFWIYHNPHCRPDTLPEWLETRGLTVTGGWDRIYRDAAPLAAPPVSEDSSSVEAVTSDTANEWADFIDTTYGLPTKPWLLALAGRPGWHHVMLRRAGGIAAVRSMYLTPEGFGWMGIEAPVPGVMALSFDEDARLCYALVEEGLNRGASYFVADIEAPSPEMDTPAYRHFEALGFKRPYFRSHYRY